MCPMTTATSYAGTVITSFREATDFTQAGATWLVCDGRWLNNSAYPALSAALSGRYGASGVTQLTAPEIRNCTIVGADSTRLRAITTQRSNQMVTAQTMMRGPSSAAAQ